MIRKFEDTDGVEVSNLIARTLREVNIKDYSAEYIESHVSLITPDYLINQAKTFHYYVICEDDKIIGCGAIGPYWGSETESCLFTIFILPEYEGRGFGRSLIEFLEKDEYALRAERIEIPSSITGCNFYRKLGYTFKDGIDTIDAEGLYRLEKFLK